MLVLWVVSQGVGTEVSGQTPGINWVAVKELDVSYINNHCLLCNQIMAK